MNTAFEKYELLCSHCAKETSFCTADVDGLAGDIEAEVDAAETDARRDTEREFEGMVDPGDLPVTPQIMKELAAAICGGNRIDAELLLDRIAEDLGYEHVNAVQIGRFTPAVARRVA